MPPRGRFRSGGRTPRAISRTSSAAAAEAARPRGKPAEMVAELIRMPKAVAVAATPGKTTSTSIVAAPLDSGGLDPTVINGEVINRDGAIARLGKGEWWVSEADES